MGHQIANNKLLHSMSFLFCSVFQRFPTTSHYTDVLVKDHGVSEGTLDLTQSVINHCVMICLCYLYASIRQACFDLRVETHLLKHIKYHT